MQTRKIVICFDGTGNEVGNNQTNILKLYNILSEDESQITHYIPGVGTMDEPRLFNWPWRDQLRAVAGLAFGLGLEDDVLDAYRFLCNTYKTPEQKSEEWDFEQGLRSDLGLAKNPDKPAAQPDQIYILGFSRGAYAARVLAGFLNNFGLIHPDKLHLITGAFRAYRSVTDFDEDDADETVFEMLRRYEDTLKPNKSVPIRSLCLFDTVRSMVSFRNPLKSLIENYSPMELRSHTSTETNPSVRIVLHALAVDERRSMFRQLLWQEGQDYYGNRFRHAAAKRTQYLRQRWFPGYHSDIGGSPAEHESGIGKLTLTWMMAALEDAEIAADAEDHAIDPPPTDAPKSPKPGLKISTRRWNRVVLGTDEEARNRDGKPFAKPDPTADIHPSTKGAWWILEVLPKSIKRRSWPGRFPIFWKWYLPLEEPRLIPDHHEIDESVQARMEYWSLYQPINLPDGHDR